jgi:hypothetical protein
MASGYQKCLDEIARAGGEGITRDMAQDILDQVDQRRERVQREQGLDRDSAIRQAAKELGDEARMAAAIEKRNALLNRQAREARRTRIESAPNVVDGMRAEIHGINTPMKGGRFSAQAEWRALQDEYQAGMARELQKAGLFKVARGGTKDEAIGREMFELSKGKAGRPGVTGDKEALQVAQIFHRYQSLAKEGVNKVGGWIGDYAGYITRTSHDADKIRQAGLARWKADILPRLDQERTFEGVTDREGFLNSTWHALTTGVHIGKDGPVGLKDPAFTGPGNAAKKASQERTLHFKDAQAWIDYNKQFGHGSLLRSLMSNLERSARLTAIMRRFGTNPRAEFENDLRHFQEALRETDPEQVAKVQAWRQALQNRFDALDGTSSIPVNRQAARIASLVRLDESMAKLGGVALTHLSAGMTRAAELRHHGVGFLESYGDYGKSFFRGRGRGETQEIADLLHAGLDGLVNDIRSRFDPDDGLPGRAASIANTYFKATGLTYLYDAMRSGAEMLLSRHLGRNLEHGFADLPPELQTMLGAYDVSPDEWEMLRGVQDHAQAGGRTFLTPDAAERVDPAAMEEALRGRGAIPENAEQDGIDRAVANGRQALAMKLHAYINDTGGRAMISPGVEERAILLQGSRPGTPAGEALRFLAQFKLWPTALVTRGLGREIYSSRTGQQAAIGIIHMAVAGAAFGYLRMVLSDLASGRNPRNPKDPATAVAAIAQGGGLGIFGDFLFGQTSRFGHSFAETLAGPVLGEGASALMDMWNNMKQVAVSAAEGEPRQAKAAAKNLSADAFRTTINQVPFANLFYARSIFEYLFTHQVQEAMSPGYLRRYEQSVRRNTGQTFWLSPSTGKMTAPTFSPGN